MRPEELAALLTQLVAQQAASPTLAACTEGYLASQEFASLAPSSQLAVRRVLLRWLRLSALADKPVLTLSRADLVRSLDPFSLGSRNTYFRRIRVLLRWCIARGYRPDDPTIGLRFPALNRARPEWTQADIAKYRAHWPLGHRARLIFELALATAQRRGDLRAFRWEHLQKAPDGACWLTLTQQKTKTPLAIPLHADLVACLEAVHPAHRKGPLIGRQGARWRPLSAGGLGILFEYYASQAGCKGRLHGLRRYACTRLAEAGATPHQIAAISGHKSLTMVAHYTKAVQQKELAAAALKLLG